MPAVSSYTTPRTTLRRVCSWCHGDLGPLNHPSQYHSYGICECCQHRYFAYLYEADEDSTTEGLHERAVGES